MSFSRKEIRSLTKKLTLNRSLTLLTDYSKLHPTVIETVSILKTNPANRTENYLNTLVNLTKNVDFFKKINLELDENAHKMCCQYMKYCYFDDGKTLFNAGDKGDSFFIVISGEVKVFVPTKDQEDNRILTETCTLGDGQAFGELALIKDQPRAASIIVSRPSHFAVLEKKDYLRILGKYSAKKLEEFIYFLSSLPAFSTWSKSALASLSYFFTLQLYTKNQIIYREDDASDYVYIIKSGEVEFHRKLIIKNKPKSSSSTSRNFPVSNKNYHNTQASLAIKTTGEIFGDEEVLNESNRIMSCKCYTAKAEIYVISQVEFRRRVKSEESLLHFSEKNQAKKIYREKLSKTIREIKLRNYEHRKTVKRLSMIETEIEPQVLISTKLNMTSRSNHSSLFKRLNIKDIDLSQMKTPISTKLSNTTFENSTFGSYVSQSFFCNSSLVSPLSPTSEIGSKSSIMMTLRNNPIRPKKLAETSSEKSFKSRLIHKKLMDCSILGAKRSRLNLMHI